MKLHSSRISTVNRDLGRGSTFLRLVDRYVGIPIVAGVGLIRKKRQLPANSRRIGLLNTAAIGDTILMGAVIADLRDRYRRAKLILFAGPSNHGVAHLIPELDLIVQLDIFNPSNAIRQIRRHHLDVLLDFGPWPRLNSIIAAFSNAKFTVGFKTRGQYRHFAYDVAVEHSSSEHELENFRNLTRAADSEPIHTPTLRYARNPAVMSASGPRGYIILHMWPGGSGALHKQWPQDRWRSLAERFLDDGYGIALTGSREQFALNEEFMTRLSCLVRSPIANIAGCTFTELANELHAAKLIVSVNTGVMHIADALNVPLVALHGPTNPRRWGPLGVKSIALESPMPGAGYLDLGFEFPRKVPDSMKALSFETVLMACRAALSQTKAACGADASARDSIISVK